MKIVVLVKYVPDAASERSIGADGTMNRRSVDGRLSELDEYAVEQALQIVEGVGAGEVVYLTMGPDEATDALRKSLSMGGDRGYHILDSALEGSDALATSLVLARAIEKIGQGGPVDLVLTGMASTDGSMGVVPTMLSERLGLPGLTLAAEVSVDGQTVTIRRDGDDAATTVTAAMPAIVSVTDQTGEARYPSFKGIMAAKKKDITAWSLADLGIDAASVGLSAAWSVVQEASPRPRRASGIRVTDEGDGGVKLIEFLSAGKFV